MPTIGEKALRITASKPVGWQGGNGTTAFRRAGMVFPFGKAMVVPRSSFSEAQLAELKSTPALEVEEIDGMPTDETEPPAGEESNANHHRGRRR